MEADLSIGVSIEKLLKRAIDVLESIDKSIDFLAATTSGLEPYEVELGQRALGRFARAGKAPPGSDTMPSAAPLKIDEALFEEIIEDIVHEELLLMQK
jgi:hypothetical protein